MVEIRPVALRDNTIVSLHRGDVVVWLEERQEGGPPTHRVWVDISTRRRTVRSVGIDLELAPGVRSNARVMTLSEVLAEKLFIFLDAVRGGRNSLRWTELFDMLVSSAVPRRWVPSSRTNFVTNVSRYASDYSFDMPTGSLMRPPHGARPGTASGTHRTRGTQPRPRLSNRSSILGPGHRPAPHRRRPSPVGRRRPQMDFCAMMAVST